MRAAVVAAVAIACGSRTPSPAPLTPPAAVDAGEVELDAALTPRVTRLAVIGASVSAGFTAPRIAEAMIAAGALPVTDAADVWMFRDPDASGARQVATVRATGPALVVALDFLFWFAYQTDQRAASLERGLALLDQLDGPLAVGDLADMRGADPRMLPPQVVPSAAELAAMNARVAAWARARPQTIVLPVAAWTQPLLDGSAVELAPGESIAADGLLFLDHLHPNPLGLWFVLTRVDRELERGFGLAADTLTFARP